MLAEDGVVVDLVDGIASIVGRVPVGHVYVDGLSVGDVGESTLSDRLVLGEGGFISITIVIDSNTGTRCQHARGQRARLLRRPDRAEGGERTGRGGTAAPGR